MARDAYIFLIPLGILALLAWWIGSLSLMVAFLVLGVFVAFFFRDPERVVPQNPRAIVSPADGKVVRVVENGGERIVSIFLSLLDVHINRAPIAGTIVRRDYRPGSFKAAYDDRASVENERFDLTIAGKEELTFSLIAGIVARRIRVWKKIGEQVGKGDRIGLIRFGSRVDMVLPATTEIAVQQGDRVYGGTSIIAHWKVDSQYGVGQ